MAMITGDNPLTACHVARELKFTTKKSTLVLTKVDNDDNSDENFEWQSIDRVRLVQLVLIGHAWPGACVLKQIPW
jgi:magnesium-transporting ATPase (P-type)